MRISDWSSDVCSSDLHHPLRQDAQRRRGDPPVAVQALMEPTMTTKKTFQSRKSTLLRSMGVAGIAALTTLLGLPVHAATSFPNQIGRASCRERVCQYV